MMMSGWQPPCHEGAEDCRPDRFFQLVRAQVRWHTSTHLTAFFKNIEIKGFADSHSFCKTRFLIHWSAQTLHIIICSRLFAASNLVHCLFCPLYQSTCGLLLWLFAQSPYTQCQVLDSEFRQLRQKLFPIGDDLGDCHGRHALQCPLISGFPWPFQVPFASSTNYLSNVLSTLAKSLLTCLNFSYNVANVFRVVSVCRSFCAV